MKICAIGDPHGDLEKIKKIPLSDIDLILVTGDLANSDIIRKAFFEAKEKGTTDFRKAFSKEELNKLYSKFVISAREVIRYLASFGKPVYFVYGNLFGMDYCIMSKCVDQNKLNIPDFEKEIKKYGNAKNTGLLELGSNNLRIAGVPYYDSKDWIREFDTEDEEKKEFAGWQEPKVNDFLKKLTSAEILLTHIPPFGILDKVNFPGAPKHWQGRHAGSRAVLNYIKSNSPRYVFCGHIHEGEGMKKVGRTEVYNLGVGGHKIIEL
jgi:Icc-related predicted phosphoesterase